jgi:hypothetical protein
MLLFAESKPQRLRLADFRCSQCGEIHSGIPGYSFDAPWPWYIMSEEERLSHGTLTPDYCILRNEDFLVRACLEIPVIDYAEPFIWGIWVSLSRENFERERRLAKDPNRTKEPPYFGWFCSRIQVYPDTLLLKTHVHSRPVGTRPFVELEPTNHPLSIEQQTGITLSRVQEITELVQHHWLHPQWDRGV